MRFKIDENLPAEVATRLRAAGHDASTVLDQKLGGQKDPVIAQVIRGERRALVTLDLDFADLRTYPPNEYFGLIVLRLAVQNTPSILRLIDRILPMLETDPLTGTLWIVDETAVRIRGEVS